MKKKPSNKSISNTTRVSLFGPKSSHPGYNDHIFNIKHCEDDIKYYNISVQNYQVFFRNLLSDGWDTNVFDIGDTIEVTIKKVKGVKNEKV